MAPHLMGNVVKGLRRSVDEPPMTRSLDFARMIDDSKDSERKCIKPVIPFSSFSYTSHAYRRCTLAAQTFIFIGKDTVFLWKTTSRAFNYLYFSLVAHSFLRYRIVRSWDSHCQLSIVSTGCSCFSSFDWKFCFFSQKLRFCSPLFHNPDTQDHCHDVEELMLSQKQIFFPT